MAKSKQKGRKKQAARRPAAARPVPAAVVPPAVVPAAVPRPREEKRSWLEGPAIVGSGGSFPGEGLGLPESGPGSVATVGIRFISIFADFVICQLIGALLHRFWHSQLASPATYAVYTWLLTATAGQTIAMRLFKIRLIGGGGRPPGLWWGLVRVIGTAFLFPPFFLDADRRGLHDRVAGTVVVRA